MRRPYVVLTVLATLVACDSKNPTAPTGPPPSPTPSAAQVVELTIGGDGRFTALSQVRQFTATARMTDGSLRDVTAEAAWSSSNPGVVSVSSTGEVTSVGLGLASIEAGYVKGAVGYLNEASLDVAVVPPGDPSRVAGSYRFMLIAAPACTTLPDWARRREYDATIDQPEAEVPGGVTALTLTVRLEPGVAPQFSGWINGSRVSFSFPGGNPGGGGWYYYYYAPTPPPFSYRIDPTSQYTLAGEALGTKGASHDVQIGGTISGVISVIDPSTNVTVADCSSANHQFSLVRQ